MGAAPTMASLNPGTRRRTSRVSPDEDWSW